MFSKTSIMKSTKTYSQQIKRLKVALEAADAVVIGAGAGLSASAGFTYTGERFERNFSDFAKSCGFRDMYSGGFYPYSTPEEYWAYWSRCIMVNRYQDPPKPVYQNLLELVQDRDYFVLTTNADHCFQKASLQALIRSGCSTPKGIMDYSNAASHAVRKPLITRMLSKP